MGILSRIVEEPPFRLLAYPLVKRLATSVGTIDRWGAVDRPHYFAGVAAAASQARRENVTAISVFEFGVAGGSGLLALQKYAGIVEAQSGIRIEVYGFDTGTGLPSLCNDYRDHPDQWRPSDYKMDVPKLEARLEPRTKLVLGEISATLPRFVAESHAPTGFIAYDLDLYSSTVDALRLLTLPGSRMLLRVPIYFDDVDFFCNHKFAGELLAITEFNESNSRVRIDKWRGVKKNRVFAEQTWLDKMYVAHDIESISKVRLDREPSDRCGLE